MREDYRAAVEEHGSIRAAARALGVPYTTLHDRLAKFPALPEGGEPVDELRARLRKNFQRRHARRQAELWLPLTLPEALPFGVVWFGDPHLGDDDCNLPLLEEHVRLCQRAGVYGAAVGDYSNNWVGRLMRKYGDQTTGKSSERELIKWFARDCGVDWRLWLTGNHDCVTPDHDVLTKRGWVAFPDVKPTDKVWGFDPKRGRARWQKINEVVRFDYNGPLYRYKTSRFSIRCTPNHRFLHRPNRRGEFVYKHASEVGREFQVQVAASGSRSGVVLKNDEIRLAAWILTDGWVERQRGYLRISQCKPERIAEIESLVQRLGLEYTLFRRSRRIPHIGNVALKSQHDEEVTIALTADASRRFHKVLRSKERLPAWVWDMSGKQFEVFAETVIAANGTAYGGTRNEGTAILYGRAEQLEELQALYVQNGYSANLTYDTRGQPRLNICKRPTSDVVALPTIEHHEGDVWCLRVPLGNFMVRHEGKAHFTGNSWNEGEAILGLIVDQAHYVASWEAKVIFRTSLDEWKVHAAHSFPGQSMWNSNHGGLRKAKMNSPAELFVEGHTHNFGLQSFEKPGDGRVAHCVQTRGYKWHDEYAVVKGYEQVQSGASVMTIFNPLAQSAAGRITTFADIALGCDFLTFLRHEKTVKASAKTPARKRRKAKANV